MGCRNVVAIKFFEKKTILICWMRNFCMNALYSCSCFAKLVSVLYRFRTEPVLYSILLRPWYGLLRVRSRAVRVWRKNRRKCCKQNTCMKRTIPSKWVFLTVFAYFKIIVFFFTNKMNKFFSSILVLMAVKLFSIENKSLEIYTEFT